MTAKKENETVTEGEGEMQGIRSRRAFMLKNFEGADPSWIMKNVTPGGKGAKKIIGRLYGFVTGTSDKTGSLPDGTPSTSVVLNGQFESEDYLSGELGNAASAYLPSAFTEQVKAMFATDENLKVVQIDLDIGVEATGKTIPYTWVIINHIEGQESTPLKRLRGSRKRPEGVALPAPKKQEALPAK